MRLLVAVLIIAAILVPVTQAALFCCESTCSEFSDRSIIEANCPEAPIDGSCINVAPACATTGCCVSAGGDEASEKSHAECSIGSGVWYEGVSGDACQELLTGPIQTGGSCEADYEPNLRVERTIGSPELTLVWDVCDGIESVTLERQGESVPLLEATSPSASRHTDDTTDWGESYRYQLTIETDTTFTETVDASTGDIRCADESGNTRFCKEGTNTLFTCTTINTYVSNVTCSECTETETGAYCISDPDACTLPYAYLNVASSEACGTLTDGSCYYDIGTNGIGSCYSCGEAASCYEFKSEQACTSASTMCEDQYGLSGCAWESSGGGIGDGLCRPADETIDYCSYLNSPNTGTRSELYSPILTSVDDDGDNSAKERFSGAYQCTEGGSTCSSAATETACNDVSLNADYVCSWDGTACVKSGEYTNPYYPPEGPTPICEDATCESDYEVPTMTVTRAIDWGKTLEQSSITYTLYVQDTNSNGDTVLISDLSNYEFRTCAGTGSACDSPFEFTQVTPEEGTITYTFEQHDIAGPATAVFSAIVRDPGYNSYGPVTIRAWVDPTSSNPQISVQTIPEADGNRKDAIDVNASWTPPGSETLYIKSGGEVVETVNSLNNGAPTRINHGFAYGSYTAELEVTRASGTDTETADFELKPPSFWINITEPNPPGVPEETETFTIRVETSETAQSCGRFISTDPQSPTAFDNYAQMSGSGTNWFDEGSITANAYVHVMCFDGTEYPTDTLEVFLVSENTKPTIIEARANPSTVVFDDDGVYRTKILVETDRDTKCRYTRNGNTVGSGEDYNTTNTLQVALSSEGEYSFDVICKDALQQDSDPYPVSVIVDPSSDLFSIVEPRGTYRTARINYAIVADATAIDGECRILELGTDWITSENNEITGTFDPTELTGFNGDGEYSFTAECRASSSSSGDMRDSTSSVTFRIDQNAPNLTARINDRSSTFTVEEPSNDFVRFTYSDVSGVTILSYNVTEMRASGGSSIVQTDSFTNLGTQGTRSAAFNFELKDESEYFVNARATDAAGNSVPVESNRMVVELPDQCKDGQQNGDETAIDCGGSCGACDIGDACNAESDCDEGAVCSEANVCFYEHCSNEIIDKDKGEEGLNCGGACGACLITLVEPSFGVSADETTDIVVATTQNMECTYGAQQYTFASNDGYTHTINDFTIGNGRALNVTCFNDQTTEWRVFELVYDPTEPIIDFDADPDFENTKTGAVTPNAYRTTWRVQSNIKVICKISDTREDYDDMEDYLGNDYTTENDSTAYRLEQNEYGDFVDAGTHTRYVECIAKNGLESGTKEATFISGPDVIPTPIVRVPESRTYNDESINAYVDGTSEGTLACWGQLESFEPRSLTRTPDSGNVFTGPLNLGSEGKGLSYEGICRYEIGPTVTNVSSPTVYFNVDRTGPQIDSVTINDPYGNQSGVTNTPNAIDVSISAQDDVSRVARYDFRLLVNGEEAASRTTLNDAFTVNGLDLSDGDRLRLEASAVDTVGNAQQAQSNTLTYELIERPDLCDNDVIDEEIGEVQPGCGGLCGPCSGTDPFCGDGDVDRPNANGVTEQCDDGSANRDSCTADPGETCTVCTTSCELYTDYTDTEPPDETAVCGDGSVQRPNANGITEECDDGSANRNEACTPDTGGSCSICTDICELETFTDTTNPVPDPTYCGDGFLQQPNDAGVIEACDRGTDVNTDDACDPGDTSCSICTTSCEVETFYADPDQDPVCGNGDIETGEQCDDGSANRNSCTAAAGTSCTVCTTSCEVHTETTPGDGPACNVDADCEGGSYCDDGTCRDADVCNNGVLDDLYETDIDCGGTCGACEEGDVCKSNLDCSEDFVCDDGTCEPDLAAICNNDVHDENYESDVDCGDVCASVFDLVCAPQSDCSTDADCTDGYQCTAGQCLTDSQVPVPESWCSVDEFNNTLSDGTYCGRTCDSLCEEGIGCRLSSDCENGLVCDDKTRTCTAPDEKEPKPQCIPTNLVPACGGECDACSNGFECFIDSDCKSDNCDAGICRSGTGVGPPITDPGAGGEEEQKSGGWWKWIIFFLLLVLLGIAGFIAYKYYYLPNKKPDYQEEQGMNAETINTGFDDLGTSDSSVTPPSGPPIMTEKQQHVNELIRQKRSEEKEQKRSEFFSAFDESKLDSEPEKIDEDTIPKTKLESTPDDEKPIVATRKKSHDSFKEILDDAKDDIDE